MGAIRLIFRAELRSRWQSWLAIAILISVVGGFVLAAAAAGRRTESAFPRFVGTYGFDSAAFSVKPVPGIARLPGVSSVTEMTNPSQGQPTCDCTRPINVTDLTVSVVDPRDRPISKLVAGHLPDPSAPDQVLASFTLQSSGVHVGSVIRVPFYAPSQLNAIMSATDRPPVPRGPTVAFHVVGIEASEDEFPSGSTPVYNLFATPAFARTVAPRTAVVYVYLVRLRNGSAGLPRLDAEFSSARMRKLGVAGYQNENSQAAAVEASIHPQAVGWWILAALAALVGLAVIGQALARQSVTESGDYPTLAAVGAAPRQLAALGMARTLAVAVAGAAGAVLLATAMSPLAPVGEARLAGAGMAFDTLVLGPGALAVVLAVLAAGLWPSWRAARAPRADDQAKGPAPSAVVTRLATAGAAPSTLIGVRHALQRRSSGATVPTGSALLGTVLAVTALTGTAVFGASLTHLLSTPNLYGVPFQLNFGSAGNGNIDVLKTLKRDKDIARISHGIVTESSIGNADVAGIAATADRGPLLFSTVTGTLPAGDGEIGLGGATMRQIGAHLHSIVRVTVPSPAGGRRTVPFRVTAQISFPVISGAVELGHGVLFTTAGYMRAACPPGPRQAKCQQVLLGGNGGGVLASVVPGPRGQAAIARYIDAHQTIATLPIAPSSLINFGEAVNFPLIFGAMLAVFGVATLAHLLVVSVSRRRREIGLLKVLGFVNRQVASTVAWQATTLALAGIAVGAPLGVAAGQALWRAFAGNLGVIPVAVVPPVLIAVLVAGIVVAANLIAAGPGLMATRSRPAQLLRVQ